jgi:hypothetical protein
MKIEIASFKQTSISLLVSSAFLVSATTGFSQTTGIFGTGVAISSDIGGTSTFDLYEITLLGDSRLAPDTSGGGSSLGAPTLVDTANGSGTSTWATGGGGEPTSGPSLGTFVQGIDTLTLDGGEDLTFKNNGANVTGAEVFYSIDGGSFNEISLAFNQDNVNGSTGDQRWYTDGADINLLNGLAAGTHTLSVFFRDDNSSDGNDFVSNNSFNYSATFAIEPVPEPSSVVLGMSGLAAFFLVRRFR